MDESAIARPQGEPLAAWFSPEQRAGTLREQRFECVSAGDLVSGRCWWPSGAPASLVVAVHELSRNKDDAALGAAAALWGSRAIATAAIDLPLHGERHNAKLSPRALAGRTGETASDATLWQDLVAQAVRDLARALDALATRGALPPVACVTFGAALPIGLAFANRDPRVAQVAVIGSSRSGFQAEVVKPLAWLARPDDLVVGT